MAQPLTVALPPNLHFVGGFTIEVAALDPATGANVSGVKVSNATFEVDLLAAGSTEQIGAILLAREAGT